MPLYEYKCPKCELEFELLRPYSKADNAAPCPKCKSKAKRAMSSFTAFEFDHVGMRYFVTGAGNSRSKHGGSAGKTRGIPPSGAAAWDPHSSSE
jgi:putative FmdB family regulatory protein